MVNAFGLYATTSLDLQNPRLMQWCAETFCDSLDPTASTTSVTDSDEGKLVLERHLHSSSNSNSSEDCEMRRNDFLLGASTKIVGAEEEGEEAQDKEGPEEQDCNRVSAAEASVKMLGSAAIRTPHSASSLRAAIQCRMQGKRCQE